MVKFPNFKAEFFSGNRQRLLAHLSSDLPVAIMANGLVQRGADNAYPFAQDANFWYLTGITHPDIVLVIDRSHEFLIAPLREGNRVTFDGQIDYSELTEVSGIKEVLNEASGWKLLDSIISKNKRLASLAPAGLYIEAYGMYSNPARARFIERLIRHTPNLEIVDIRRELARLRMLKQPEELVAIQAAIDITTATLKEVLKQPRADYCYEYGIEADITRGFRRRGALGHAFEPIVASGKRACTLHYLDNNGVLSPDDLIVIDVGANVSGYAADITRTVAVTKPTKRQKDVFLAVKEAQSYAFSLLKPGVSFRTYENKMERFMGTKLKQLGVIDNLKKDNIRRYFPHATSHFLGLNPHDAGDYSSLIQPGYVLAVEPGIYLPEESIGVRIEDDVLITENGNKNLSSSLPVHL
ncbi:Xaa-Pro peptidase family protein [Patescibacteria group bacterium]|nr:Xaa-Pro peptidase family protein [Patescibacteria group bacterium]